MNKDIIISYPAIAIIGLTIALVITTSQITALVDKYQQCEIQLKIIED